MKSMTYVCFLLDLVGPIRWNGLRFAPPCFALAAVQAIDRKELTNGARLMLSGVSSFAFLGSPRIESSVPEAQNFACSAPNSRFRSQNLEIVAIVPVLSSNERLKYPEGEIPFSAEGSGSADLSVDRETPDKC